MFRTRSEEQTEKEAENEFVTDLGATRQAATLWSYLACGRPVQYTTSYPFPRHS